MVMGWSRFNGFASARRKRLKPFQISVAPITRLKPGVNESNALED
jgi:hypothetical protein